MSELNDDLLRSQLGWLANSRDDADWGDIRRRATRGHRKRVLTFTACAGMAVVGVASAIVLGNPTVDFLRAKKAPPKIVTTVGALQVGLPPGMSPDVIPGQTRRIGTMIVDGKPRVVYVAPTKQGGFCEVLANVSRLENLSRCVKSRSGPAAKGLKLEVFGGSHGPRFLEGSFFAARGHRLVVAYADGTADDIPFVWVTAPIDAGFFAYDIPAAKQNVGGRPIRPVSISLYDADDRLLTRAIHISGPGNPSAVRRLPRVRRVPGFRPLIVPSQAIYAKRKLLFAVRAENGTRFGLWVAPKRGDSHGLCYWTNRSTGCTTGTLPAPSPAALKAHPELRHEFPIIDFSLSPGSTVLLCCDVQNTVATVELRFQDGAQIALVPREGFLLFAIPRKHYAPGHRLEEIVARNASGAVIATRRVTPSMREVYPCKTPRTYAYGVKMCP